MVSLQFANRWKWCWNYRPIETRLASYDAQWRYVLASLWFHHIQIRPCSSSSMFCSLFIWFSSLLVVVLSVVLVFVWFCRRWLAIPFRMCGQFTWHTWPASRKLPHDLIPMAENLCSEMRFWRQSLLQAEAECDCWSRNSQLICRGREILWSVNIIVHIFMRKEMYQVSPFWNSVQAFAWCIFLGSMGFYFYFFVFTW